MYAGHVVCCPLVSRSEYGDGTDRRTNERTDARPLHYAFRYYRDQRNNVIKYTQVQTTYFCLCEKGKNLITLIGTFLQHCPLITKLRNFWESSCSSSECVGHCLIRSKLKWPQQLITLRRDAISHRGRAVFNLCIPVWVCHAGLTI